MLRIAAAAVFVLAMPAAASAQSAEPQLPAWLAGCWEMRDGERWAEECWTIPRGGMMLGSGWAGTGERVTSWESMRIALDEPNADGPAVRMAFAASPNGTGWTTFGWSPSEEAGVTFHSVANDYPQRVRYWREGDLLKAEVSLADGSRPTRWTFSRMGN